MSAFRETIRQYETEVKKLELRALCVDGEERSRLEKKRAGLLKLTGILRSFDEGLERR